MPLRKSYHHSRGRVCAKCPKPIRNSNQSGQCRSCLLLGRRDDPEFQRRRVEGVRRKLRDDPLYAARMRENMRRVGKEAGQDPMLREKRSARGREIYATILSTPEVRVKVKATRVAVGKKLSDQRLAWCPEHLRGEYLFLIRRKRIKAVEARQLILAQHAADEAKLSPFERQMRALERGAKLIEVGEGPSLARPGVYRP